MINPFQYGGAVGKDAFCNRKEEPADPDYLFVPDDNFSRG
jgi:hypothetical protein